MSMHFLGGGGGGVICVVRYMKYFVPRLKRGPKRGNILLHEAKKQESDFKWAYETCL